MNKDATTLTSIGEAAEKFLKIIGDTEYKLAKKIFEYNNTVVLLLKVRCSGILQIIAVSYDSVDDCISDIEAIDCDNVAKAEKYVSRRMPCNDITKIAEECRSNVTYALRDNVIFFTDKDEKKRERVADLNRFALEKAIQIINEVGGKTAEPQTKEIAGEKFFVVDKKAADSYLGSNRSGVYKYFSSVDIIYSRKESGKTRYSYRDRSKNGGEKSCIEYFAVKADKIEPLLKGGDALPG